MTSPPLAPDGLASDGVAGAAPFSLQPVRRSSPPLGSGRRLSTGAGAAVLLGLLLGAWSLTLDPHGRLGADTGGKLATLAHMDTAATWRPDVGYWAAAADPEAILHPLHYTQVFGESDKPRYVNVTTLPLLYATFPLYAVGGERLALLIPVLGAVAAALAARRLARQLGSAHPERIFWLVGLAGPTAVYALDVWEHTWGVALAAWAVVASGIAERDGPDGIGLRPRRPVVLGLCLGVGMVLRLELAVYGVVLFAMLVLLAAVGRAGPGAGRRLAVALAAMFVPLLANEGLERLVLGTPLRSGRTLDAASRAGSQLWWRIREAFDSLFGTNLAVRSVDLLVGLGIVVALLVAASAPARRARQGAVAAAALFGLRFAAGFGLIIGMVGVAPAVVPGVVGVGRDRPLRRLVALSLVPIPAVWLTSYAGVSAAAWGPRYLLTSAVLLSVAGLVVLERRDALVRAVVVATCVAVGAYGLVNLAVRTHQGGRTGERIVELDPATVVVSQVPFLFREIGSRYSVSRRWLEADDSAALRRAAALARAAGAPRLAVVGEPGSAGTVGAAARGRSAPVGWRPVGRERLAYFGRDLELVRFVPAGPGR